MPIPRRTGPTANANPAAHTGRSYVGRINTDWLRIAQTATPAVWGRACPRLAAADTVDEVLRANCAADRDGSDEILHALLTAHAGGDELAGRVVLQTMLGSVQRLVLTAHYRHLDDVPSAAMEAMWTAIRCYPLRRRRAVAANLALQALHYLERAAQVATPLPRLVEQQLERDQLTGRGGQQLSPAVEAAHALAWARDREVLTSEEVRLLAMTYLAENPLTSEELGAQLGLTAAAVRKRQSRAVARLAAAVSASLAGASSEVAPTRHVAA